jgi:uncharacterized OB-fold protein
MKNDFVLPDEILPVTSTPDDLDAPFWEGTRAHELRIQRCRECRRFQWGPELLCHRCHAFELDFAAVRPFGTIYSWHRTWQPGHPALAAAAPYVVLLVELDDAPEVRLIGNWVGDQMTPIRIGSPVRAVFEDHKDYTLVHWEEPGFRSCAAG